MTSPDSIIGAAGLKRFEINLYAFTFTLIRDDRGHLYILIQRIDMQIRTITQKSGSPSAAAATKIQYLCVWRQTFEKRLRTLR